MLFSLSWLPYKQGQTHLSTEGKVHLAVDEGDWLCYLSSTEMEKFIYGCYNISMQSDNPEFVEKIK